MKNSRNSKISVLRTSKYITAGFTLLELLMVMAVLGVLAVSVMILLDPAELMARARDTGRKTAVNTLGRALVRYLTVSADASYPDEAGWQTELLDSQVIATIPAGISYSHNLVTPCSVNPVPNSQPTYCYVLGASEEEGAIIYAKLESSQETSKCLPQESYMVFSTQDARGGTACFAAEPTPWTSGAVNYID